MDLVFYFQNALINSKYFECKVGPGVLQHRVQQRTCVLKDCQTTTATITRCDLSTTILFKLVDNLASVQEDGGDKSHCVIVA